MQAHYALVDDLFGREEFEKLVGEKIAKSGGMLDERTAAMLVVRDAGRQHRKIANLPADSSLISFFGKIISITGPKAFERSDGSPGQVARVFVGDDSGEITLVLWDERASAVEEIEKGEVLEIVGRLKSLSEVYVMDMQKTACDISIRSDAGSGAPEQVSLDVVVLAMSEVIRFTRRDGTEGERVETVIGNADGTARLICWSPKLLEDTEEGMSVHIEGARLNPRSEQKEYSIGDQAVISALAEPVEISFTPVAQITEGAVISLTGKVTRLSAPRSFTTRNGRESHVQNGTIEDNSGSVNVVLWGDMAQTRISPGEDLAVYNATVKPARTGGHEVHVGWGSAIRSMDTEVQDCVFEGTVIDTGSGRAIDNGDEWYYLIGEDDLPTGLEVRVSGIRRGRRIKPRDITPVNLSRDQIMARISTFFS